MKKSFFRSIFVAAFGIVFLFLSCTSTKNSSKDIPLKQNPDVISGKLDNGMSYFVLQNAYPANRIVLRLVVNVGSLAEEENERGVAHLIEHMAFNGTEHFEKNSLIDYAESIGMDFGAEVNAHTSFEETVYKLEVPADNKEYLDTALLIFKDWASAITFDPEELEKERGVVLEEWRGRLGLNGRLTDTLLPFELKGSDYVNRLPIGLPEVIQNISREEVVNFYNKWYRPENMAVIVSGYADPKVVEWLIKSTMSDIPASKDRVQPPKGVVPVQTQKDVLVFADPEMTYTQVQVVSQKEDFGPATTEGDIRKSFVAGIVRDVMNSRLAEITADPQSPWLAANAIDYTETYSSSFNGFYFVPKDGMFGVAFQQMLDEIDRVLLHGITQKEFERAVNSMLVSENQWYDQRDAIHSADRANELVSYFLTGATFVSDDDYIELARRLLASITVDEVNAKAAEFFAGRGTLCMILTTPEVAAELPSKEDLINFWENYTSQTDISAYEDNAMEGEIMERPAVMADIISTRKMEGLKAAEYVLSNGARIIVRKNEADKAQISMTAISLGGASLVSDNEYPSALISPMYAIYSGLGGMDISQLQKYLSTRYVGINIMVNDFDERITGQASPDTLENLLQLVNQVLTKPQFTEQGWNFVNLSIQQQAKAYNVQPADALVSRVRHYLYGDSIRHTAINDKFASMIDPALSERIFRERFADPADFTFIFSGDLDEDSVVELCRYYIGTIPGGKTKETPVYEESKFPAGITKDVVKKGQEDKGLVYICFGGKLPPAKDVYQKHEDTEFLEQLRCLAEIKLREIIREDKSGTYGVSIYAGIQGDEERSFAFQISFGCEPAREKELEAEVIAALKKLTQELPSQADIDKLRESYRRNFEMNQLSSPWWIEMISAAEVYKSMPPEAAYDSNFAIRNVTAQAMQQQAKKYLDTTNYVTVFLEPEK